MMRRPRFTCLCLIVLLPATPFAQEAPDDSPEATQITEAPGASADTPRAIFEPELPPVSGDPTITETAAQATETIEDAARQIDFDRAGRDLEGEGGEQAGEPEGLAASQRRAGVLILLGLVEAVITFAACFAAFRLIGSDINIGQLTLVSVILAISSVILATLLPFGVFHVIHLAATAVILVGLLYFASHLREWGALLRVSLTARLAALAAFWLALAAGRTFLSL